MPTCSTRRGRHAPPLQPLEGGPGSPRQASCGDISGARRGPSFQMWRQWMVGKGSWVGPRHPCGRPPNRAVDRSKFLMCLLGKGVSKTISKAGGSPEKGASFPVGRGDFKGNPAAEKVSKNPCLSIGSKSLPGQQQPGEGSGKMFPRRSVPESSQLPGSGGCRATKRPPAIKRPVEHPPGEGSSSPDPWGGQPQTPCAPRL